MINIAVVVYVAISIVAIVLLFWKVKKCSHNKESFCGTCTGAFGNFKTCTNRPLLQKLYNEGVLTEFSNLQTNGKWDTRGMPYDSFVKYQGGGKKCANSW